jgi:hypothetical protein
VRLLILLAAVLLVAAGTLALTRGDHGDDGAAASRDGAIVWAVGDGGNGSDEARKVADLIAADRPRRVLYLGDVYEHGTPQDFHARFATVYARLARRMDPTPGNHDWGHHRVGYDPYWRSIKGRRVPHRYAFTTGGWRIISLNSETPDDAGQLAFLRRELRRATSTCVLAFMHRPRFNAGMHRDEQLDVDRIWRSLRGKAALLLSGHDHDLQRFRPIGGTVQLVIGAGGRERYDVDERDDRLAFSNDRVDGALRMQLRPGLARLRIISADGRTLDRSTVRCR